MHCFDDFDAWGETVRGADLRLVCDGVEQPRWTIDVRHVGSLALQTAFEGGGNVCHGGNTHAGTMLFLPLTHPDLHVVNCERLDADAMFVIPPRSDFSIHVRRRAHAWASIALPGTGADGQRPNRAHVVRPPHGRVAHLRSLVRRLAACPTTILDSPAGTTAARELTAATAACLQPPADSPSTRVGRPRIERMDIIRRTLALLDADSLPHPSIEDLADHAEVTERTLRRAFHEALGVGPLAYLKLRLLHRVRRALLRADPAATTVSQVLSAHEIWDFGRFAGSYRRHFGESPSDTLRRG